MIPQIVKVRRNMAKVSIAQHPITVELKRPVKSSGRAGGINTDTEPITIDPQTFKLYSYGRLWDIDERSSSGGTRNELLWSLLGEYDADVKKGDAFEWDDRYFEVRFVRPQTLLGYIVSKQVELRELT